MQPYLSQHSRTLKTEGIVLLVLGFSAILVPTFFTIAIELLLGVLLLLAGVGAVLRSFQLKGLPGSSISLFGGVFSVVVGLLFLTNPLQGVLTLTVLLAFLFIFQGGIEIFMAFNHRMWNRWGWMFWSGLSSIVLAAVLLLGLPDIATWGVGFLVGIHLLFSGTWLWQLGNEVQKTASE